MVISILLTLRSRKIIQVSFTNQHILDSTNTNFHSHTPGPIKTCMNKSFIPFELKKYVTSVWDSVNKLKT